MLMLVPPVNMFLCSLIVIPTYISADMSNLYLLTQQTPAQQNHISSNVGNMSDTTLLTCCRHDVVSVIWTLF